MSIKKIILYVILAIFIAFSLTFLTFVSPLSMVLQYTSLGFVIQEITPRGEKGMGITILGVLFVNFLWGLLPLFWAYRKNKSK